MSGWLSERIGESNGKDAGDTAEVPHDIGNRVLALLDDKVSGELLSTLLLQLVLKGCIQSPTVIVGFVVPMWKALALKTLSQPSASSSSGHPLTLDPSWALPLRRANVLAHRLLLAEPPPNNHVTVGTAVITPKLANTAVDAAEAVQSALSSSCSSSTFSPSTHISSSRLAATPSTLEEYHRLQTSSTACFESLPFLSLVTHIPYLVLFESLLPAADELARGCAALREGLSSKPAFKAIVCRHQDEIKEAFLRREWIRSGVEAATASTEGGPVKGREEPSQTDSLHGRMIDALKEIVSEGGPSTWLLPVTVQIAILIVFLMLISYHFLDRLSRSVLPPL